MRLIWQKLRSSSRILTIAGWISLLACILKPGAGLSAPGIASAMQMDCSALLTAIVGETGSIDTLIDPVLTTHQQVDERLQAVSDLHTCLGNGLQARSIDEQRIHTLCEYYLIFAGGYQTPPGGSRLDLVDLATSDDPAVISLRQEAGVPAPRGYVYVRFYAGRQSMPALVQRVFENPSVDGATFLTRYVAVPVEQESAWAEQALQAQILPKTISHELVHAYINASLGVERYDQLPLWYHEGIAIYFSGSGEDHQVVTPDFTIRQTSPADYRQYQLNFEYLEAHLDRARLLDLIRASVEQADASLLYQELSIKDGMQLAELARKWDAQRTRLNLLIVLGIVLLLGWGLVTLAPEVECVCGHQGRRSDFQSGFCPSCGRRIRKPPSAARRLVSTLAPSCEVCGRRFPPWRAGDLEHYLTRVRVWATKQGGQPLKSPRFSYMDRICHTCLAESRELWAAEHDKISAEMEARRAWLTPLLREWLQTAPRFTGMVSDMTEVLSLELAVEQIILAVLDRYDYAWMETHADFQILDIDGYNPLQQPPPTYRHVIRTFGYKPGLEVELIGSFYRLGKDRIVIEWE